MKRNFFTLIILFTMSANAQIADTVKVMNVHTKYYFVEEIEVSRIKQINFYDDWMNVSNNNSFFIEAIFNWPFTTKTVSGILSLLLKTLLIICLKRFDKLREKNGNRILFSG